MVVFRYSYRAIFSLQVLGASVLAGSAEVNGYELAPGQSSTNGDRQRNPYHQSCATHVVVPYNDLCINSYVSDGAGIQHFARFDDRPTVRWNAVSRFFCTLNNI